MPGFNDRRDERRRQEREAEKQDLIDAAHDFCDRHIIRECAVMNCYLLKTQDKTWNILKSEVMGKHFPEWIEPQFSKAMTVVMDKRGYNYVKVTYSYNPQPSDVMNLLNTADWLQADLDPNKQPHWLFGVLFQALGGNKEENIDHLEHTLAWKYINPQDSHLLPCILIHGEGECGKNVLVNTVLKRVFDGQTNSASREDVLGPFNSILEGKAVMLIDEGAEGLTDQLKILVGNREIVINRKNVPQFTQENTALYMISSNRSEGGVWLDRTKADRRISVLHVPEGQSFPYWVAIHHGWLTDQDDEETRDAISDGKARQWLKTEGRKILEDPEQIAIWLGHIINKHILSADKGMPNSLHGADYKALLDVQEPLHDRLIKAVFGDPKFTHVNRAMFNIMYSALCKVHRTKHPIRDRVLYQKVDKYLERLAKRKPGKYIVLARKHQMGEGPDSEGAGYNWIWMDKDIPNKHRQANNRYYLRDGFMNNPAYIGPELDSGPDQDE